MQKLDTSHPGGISDLEIQMGYRPKKFILNIEWPFHFSTWLYMSSKLKIRQDIPSTNTVERAGGYISLKCVSVSLPGTLQPSSCIIN